MWLEQEATAALKNQEEEEEGEVTESVAAANEISVVAAVAAVLGGIFTLKEEESTAVKALLREKIMFCFTFSFCLGGPPLSKHFLRALSQKDLRKTQQI